MGQSYSDARTIAERVALGREVNRLQDDAIVPFPNTWNPNNLLSSFRTGGNALLVKLLNEGFEQRALYPYRDKDGAIIGGAVRLDSGSKKQVLPIRATRVVGCNPFLEVKAIDAPRPLYGLDRLASHPDRDVVIVEGEKAADAGQILFADKVVVTWPLGAQGVPHVDLRPLAGRDITIWPDNDNSGREAAEKLGLLLEDLGVAQLRIVQIPKDFPPKWDVADDLPEQAHD